MYELLIINKIITCNTFKTSVPCSFKTWAIHNNYEFLNYKL